MKLILVTSTPTIIYRAANAIESQSDGWKLASYEVAGFIAEKFSVLKGRRNQAAHFPASLQDGFILDD